ncbi:MAG: GNAT family N-acetyltransferase [Clostridia bacterium]|nr:GNAT family N-acetyltransferase [Clostridia bacterium]
MIILRDMLESDIEDYVRWFTTETEWSDWDAPWEPVGSTPEEERESWTEYYGSVKDLPSDAPRQKFEIELDGRHVGWVSRYYDLDYVENPERIPAVGIDLAAPDARGKGAGTEALRQFIDYLKAHGARSVFTQTWSGNVPMLRVAEKLGFVPYACEKDLRTVRGQKYDALTWKLDLAPEERMETERLILDRVRETDKEDYFNSISHDKKVLETFVCRYAESLGEFDFSTYLGRDDLFAIRLKETGRLIGILLYFDEADGACEIGYGIGSKHWGKGYTTEAVGRFLTYLFEEKGLKRVRASYFTGNDASRRVMEKCGMSYERFSEKEFEYLGLMRDLTYYAIDAPQSRERGET